MKHLVILIFLVLFFSCSKSDPVLVTIDGKEYVESYIVDQIKRANKKPTESEIKNYIDNVLIASHTFASEAELDSNLVNELEINKANIKKSILFEQIMEDSVINKTDSESEIQFLNELNKYEYTVQVFLFKTDQLIQPSKENISKFESHDFLSKIKDIYPNSKSYERSEIVFSNEKYQAIKELIYLNKKYHVMISYGNITGVIKRLTKKETEKTFDLALNKYKAIHKNFLKNKLINSMFFNFKILYNDVFVKSFLEKRNYSPELYYAEYDNRKLTELDSNDFKKFSNPKIKNEKRVVSSVIYPKLIQENLVEISKNYPVDNDFFDEKYDTAKKTFLVSKFNSKYIQNEFPFTAENSEKKFEEYYVKLPETLKKKYKGRKLSLLMDFLRQKNNAYHVDKRDSILSALKIKYKD